ncbi:MAG: dihydroorotase [Bacteroidales bacterium]|nr:dihydroorotase [Bacteroidales bacterium]
MNNPFYICNALIVNENKRFSGGVFVQQGIISEIFVGNAPPDFHMPAETIIIDAKQKYLLPGVIDDHVHFREPGLTAKGDIYTESRAAVSGGITSYMEMPNTIPNATTLKILEEKFELASRKSLANYSFFLGATNSNISEIEQADPAKICGVKLFMGTSTGNMMVDDPDVLKAIFARSPLLIVVHAEEDSIIQQNLSEFKAKFGEDIPASAHPMIRNAEACFSSSEKAVNLARENNSRLHLAHLSTVKELDLLQNDIPLSEKKITGEVCIHHLWFDDRDYADLGSLIQWNPAIKTSQDREGLFAGLLNDKIDLIATDHAPHLKGEKDNQYTGCPSGGPLVQHSLVAMFGFFQLGKISAEKIVDKMCHAPAILYGVNNRGFIRKGYAADLVLVDPDSPWTVEPENILYKCGWSPFMGVTFKSRVTHTWVNGNLVYDRGNFNEAEKGERLVFNGPHPPDPLFLKEKGK